MVHESVLDVIHGGEYDGSDYEDGVEEEEEEEEEEEGEEAGQLRLGFKAMDITRMSREEESGGATGGEEGGEDGGKVQRRKKSRRKRRGDRRKQQQPVSIERFVVQTCRRIEETKYPLFREAVDRIGVDAMKALLTQVDVIERCGGQMTADGLRRRSAGGVLWNLLRGHVGGELYKEIMKEGNRKHLEQQKARLKARESERVGNPKRPHTDPEPSHDVKRPRTSTAEHAPSDNVRNPAALQHAWVQGLKIPSQGNAPLRGNAPSRAVAVKRVPVSQRIRMPVSYGDLVEDGEIASDSPICGVTEGGTAGVAAAEEGEVTKEVRVPD